MNGILYRIRWWTEDLQEHFRKKSSEPRLWVVRPEEELHEETCSPEIDRVLAVVGLAESRAAAQRLLKSNSVEIRDFWCFDSWSKVSIKSDLPKGEPVLLRTGKKFFGIVTVMSPDTNQTLIFWRKFLREGKWLKPGGNNDLRKYV